MSRSSNGLMISRRGMLASGAGAAILAGLPGIAFATMATPTRPFETSNGRVQGLERDGVQAFKGIRYGAPPTATKRFMPPERPEPWDGVADATMFGAPAMQLVPTLQTAPTAATSLQFSTILPVAAEVKFDNEDCLFLNVWKPAADGNKRPVMVWFHGGGFALGSGAWPIYDGTRLASRHDVVVVTVNHRLNVFGYLDLSRLGGGAYAHSGNAGMSDLVLALEWVRDNIDAFGGDPANVTIFGESGGGVKVSTLLAMPKAQGLFHKAIIQSGPGLTATPQAGARALADALLEELNIAPASFAQINAVPADTLLAAAGAASLRLSQSQETRFGFSPVVDGEVLPAHPFTPEAPATGAQVPVLIGWNKDENTIFQVAEPWFGKLTEEELNQRANAMFGDKAATLLAETRKAFPDYSPTHLFSQLGTAPWFFAGSVQLAERKAAQAAPVYMYNLVWETPVFDGILRCPHSLDMPLIFDNVEIARPILGPGKTPQKLADQMSKAWVAFARTGNPNVKGMPDWPQYDAETRATMIFDVKSRIEHDPLGDLRRAAQG